MITIQLISFIHLVWTNVFFYLFTGFVLLFGLLLCLLLKMLKKKS